MPIKQITVTYVIKDRFDEHDFECAKSGAKLNIAISDALNTIRTRLKYCSDETSDSEVAFLEELRATLNWIVFHSIDTASISKAKAAELLGISLIDMDNYRNSLDIK